MWSARHIEAPAAPRQQHQLAVTSARPAAKEPLETENAALRRAWPMDNLLHREKCCGQA
jgi:hypothetical protein